jgi:hypothetical protein
LEKVQECQEVVGNAFWTRFLKTSEVDRKRENLRFLRFLGKRVLDPIPEKSEFWTFPEKNTFWTRFRKNAFWTRFLKTSEVDRKRENLRFLRFLGKRVLDRSGPFP